MRTDYQGLGTPGVHPYLIGESEGRGVLDIIRAARDLDPSVGKRFLIAGHSQGGQAALFAAAEANSWTPDLKLRGTASYAPASHLYEQAVLLPSLSTPSALSALAVLITQGASTASADVNPWQLLRTPARGLYPLVNQVCLPSLGTSNRFAGIAPAKLLRGTRTCSLSTRSSSGENPDVVTARRSSSRRGAPDTTVFPIFTDELNDQLQKSGDDVRYQVYPGVDHGGIVQAAEPDVLPWFEDLLPPRG